MGDEGEAAPAPAPATQAPTPAPVQTTTSGADIFEGNAWLTAGAVVFYSTWALWVKLRKMSLKRNKIDAQDDTDPDRLDKDLQPQQSQQSQQKQQQQELMSKLDIS